MSERFVLIACLLCLLSTNSLAATEEKCSLKKINLDIVFLIDGSFSILPQDFKKGLQFVSNFVDFLRDQGIEVEDGEARVGVIEYSSKVTVAIPLGLIRSPPILKERINSVAQSDGQTYTGQGLTRMHQMFQNNARNESAVQVGFVLTDGVTSREDSHVMEEMAGELLTANITMYALGVGNDTSKQELDFIAGNESRVFQVGKYDSLDDVSGMLFETVCVEIQTKWENTFVKPEVLVPLGGIIVIVIVAIVVAVVMWRLAIMARRKLILNQLDEAKQELSRSQSEINKLYLNPKQTVNMSDIVRATGGGAMAEPNNYV